jgi:predicted protein tyrosine phosphatase
MNIEIVSHSEASRIITDPPSDIKALVSIHSPEESRMIAFFPNDGLNYTKPCTGFEDFPYAKISLCFDDACVPGRDILLATTESIGTFIKWSDGIDYSDDVDDTILFHCQAGQARSTSLALAFLTYKSGKGSEQESIEHIAHIRPSAWFNDLVVELSDNVLNRGGELISAVDMWKHNHREA